jgi:F0F1-type ATP synthase assembly protein I
MNLHELSSLGMEFAFIIVGSVLLGNYLDGKFSSSPLYVLVLSLLGFSFAIYHIVMRARRFQEKNQNEKNKSK